MQCATCLRFRYFCPFENIIYKLLKVATINVSASQIFFDTVTQINAELPLFNATLNIETDIK